MSALRIWLYYNMTRFEKKKDKDFRGRQRNIYQKWFKESWGDLPSFDSNLEASMMDGQKYSIVPERYAYTGKSMSTKERPFVWDTIKDEMNLEYEPLLKMP